MFSYFDFANRKEYKPPASIAIQVSAKSVITQTKRALWLYF